MLKTTCLDDAIYQFRMFKQCQKVLVQIRFRTDDAADTLAMLVFRIDRNMMPKDILPDITLAPIYNRVKRYFRRRTARYATLAEILDQSVMLIAQLCVCVCVTRSSLRAPCSRPYAHQRWKRHRHTWHYACSPYSKMQPQRSARVRCD